MTARQAPHLKTFLGSSIGIALVVALIGLALLRWSLPLLHHGTFDYDAAANDPMVWTRLYVGLLVAGLVPSLLGLAFSLEGVLLGDGREAWAGVGLNLTFLLTVARLAWILAGQGFFGFVMASMQAFIEV